MARTFNRQPYSVPTPSKNDVKDYFMTQANWKGLINNKNFLTVDQESFEEANNVYVDEEFVLKSRPSIKIDETPVKDKEIKDVHYFNNGLTLYLENHLLHIVKNNAIITTVNVTGDYRLLQIKDFILLFTDDNLRKIDVNGNVTNADIYIPKTKLVELDGSESDLESKNIFTDEEITVYQYSSQILNIKSELAGKKVSVKINNEIYNFEFNEYATVSIFKDSLQFVENIALDKFYENEHHKYLPLTISSKDTIAYYENSTNNIYYSVDGIIFNKLITLPIDRLFNSNEKNHGANIELKFARNNPSLLTMMLKESGDYVTGDLKAGLYFISVESDLPDGSLRYRELTLIDTSRNLSVYPSFAFDVLDYDRYVIEDHYYHIPSSNANELRVCYKYVNKETVIHRDIYYGQTTSQGGYEVVIVPLLTISNSKVVYILDTSRYSFLYSGNINDYSTQFNRLEVSGFKQYNYELADNDNFIVYAVGEQPSSYYIDNDSITNLTNRTEIYPSGAFFYPIYGVKNNLGYGIRDGKNVLSKLEGLRWHYLCDLIAVKENEIYKINNHSSKLYYAIQSDNIIIRSNYISDVLTLEVKNDGAKKYFVPDKISQLTNIYISKDNVLQISQQSEDEDALYFPEINKQLFSSKITNMHPLSETEMGIFLSNEIWRNYLTEKGYAYSKSRLDFGCKDGNDIETSFDGKYTLLDTDRGFVALAYQDFVASTEQSATFISDNIQSLYNDFRRSYVKLAKYENYLLLYNGTNSSLVYDFRTGSWWPWTISNLNKFVRNDDSLTIIKDNRVCKLDYSSLNYYDDVITKEDVDWSITSQKLHLNANNYNKHIINMTFSAIENEDANNLLSMKLNVKNYRHFIDEGKEESFDYKVELIRTFVKRLNYAKVREFQYTLSMDNENVIKLPLSLSAITIKYKIGGQVR